MSSSPIILLTFLEKLFFYSYYLLSCLLYIIFSLVTIALFTVVERKIMAALQKRKGPNVHGIWGSLQAFADGLKLLLKEDFVPSTANAFLFRAAPIYTFFIALSSWAVLPFSLTQSYFFSNLGILYIFALSSLGVYGIILSGWASNSKYSFLGSLRSAAQMISYEVSLGFIIITLCMLCGSLSLNKFVLDQILFWFIIPFFPLFFIFFISIVAETNRAPFDLPEAEAELVSGYNVEYGGISFALFFLAEYSNIILMSTLLVLLFLGGWWPLWGIPFFSVIDATFNFYFIFWLSLKVQIILGIFVWLRVSFPRYRYDQLMFLGWNVLLPFSLSLFFSYSVFLFYYDCLPAYNFYNHPNYIYYCKSSVDDINDATERSFYYWDRFHELDEPEENVKENVSLSDIANYKDEIKTRNYFFERQYWQKVYFIDTIKKHSSFIDLELLEYSNKLPEFLFEQDNLPLWDSISVKNIDLRSMNTANLLYNLSSKDDVFCNTKQCVAFFADPFFNISDVYMKAVDGLKSNSSTLSPEHFVSMKIIKSCHPVWEFLHRTFVQNLSLSALDMYSDFEGGKNLFYFYSFKNKDIFLEYQEIKQAALTFQVIIEKYKYIANVDKDAIFEALIKYGENTSSIENFKPSISDVDEIDADNIFIFSYIWDFINTEKMSMKDLIDTFEIDESEFDVITKNQSILKELRDVLENLNIYISKKRTLVTESNDQNAEIAEKGKWTIEIVIKKKA